MLVMMLRHYRIEPLFLPDNPSMSQPPDIPKPVTEEAPAADGSADAARRKSVFPLAGTTVQGDVGGAEYDQLFAYNFDDPVALDDATGDRSPAKKVTLDDIVGWLQEVKVPGISPYEQVCVRLKMMYNAMIHYNAGYCCGCLLPVVKGCVPSFVLERGPSKVVLIMVISLLGGADGDGGHGAAHG